MRSSSSSLGISCKSSLGLNPDNTSFTSSAIDEASPTEHTELICCRGSLLAHMRLSIVELPGPSGLLVGADRESNCWLISGFEVDKEFFICSNVFLASGLRTGDGLPVIGPSPLFCIKSLCSVELRVGPAFDWVWAFGESNVLAMVDPTMKPLGLKVERIDGDTPLIDIDELFCTPALEGPGDKSVNISDKGEETLWNMLTGTEEESDAIVLFAAEFEPTVVVEESEGCRGMDDAPNIISSVVACQKFMFVNCVTFVPWIILEFPLILLTPDIPGSCFIC